MKDKGVPVALDIHGQVVKPQDAHPEGFYTCLGCKERVAFVAAHQRFMYGKVVDVISHFSHLTGSQCSATGESLKHLGTKLSLEQYCQRNPELRFSIQCPDCEQRRVKRITRRRDEEVCTEFTVGPYRLDVAIYNVETHRVRLGIEVLYSHAVDEDKAAGLDIPWFEVDSLHVFRRDSDKQHIINVCNTNYFLYDPCSCGNNAFSFKEARRRKEERHRQAAAEQQARLLQEQREKRRQQQEELERRRQERAEELADIGPRVQPLEVRSLGALSPEQEQLRVSLLTEIPDIFQRLLTFTCTLTNCPKCQQQGLFFDPGGMNMMPVWTQFVYKQTPDHPWECRCVGCGWHGSRPPTGALYTFQGDAFQEQPRRRQGPVQEPFWWNRDD